MQPHDLTREAQSDAGAVLFCRKAGDEDLFLHVGRDAPAIVLVLNDGPTPSVHVYSEFNVGVLLIADGLEGIERQIDQDLLEKIGVRNTTEAGRGRSFSTRRCFSLSLGSASPWLSSRGRTECLISRPSNRRT